MWKGLNDPKVLQQCIPGCESIEASSPTQMSAKVVLKIGPVKAAFRGAVTLSDIKAPESYRISGKGEGGFAGFASGGATVKLTANNASETLMEYDVDAQVGGKIACPRLAPGRLHRAVRLPTSSSTRFASRGQTVSCSPRPETKAKAVKKPAKKPVAKKPVKAKKVAAKAKKKVVKSRKR